MGDRGSSLHLFTLNNLGDFLQLQNSFHTLSWFNFMLNWLIAEHSDISTENLLESFYRAGLLLYSCGRQSSNMFRQSWISALTFMRVVCFTAFVNIRRWATRHLLRYRKQIEKATFSCFKDVEWGFVCFSLYYYPWWIVLCFSSYANLTTWKFESGSI